MQFYTSSLQQFSTSLSQENFIGFDTTHQVYKTILHINFTAKFDRTILEGMLQGNLTG